MLWLMVRMMVVMWLGGVVGGWVVGFHVEDDDGDVVGWWGWW